MSDEKRDAQEWAQRLERGDQSDPLVRMAHELRHRQPHVPSLTARERADIKQTVLNRHTTAAPAGFNLWRAFSGAVAMAAIAIAIVGAWTYLPEGEMPAVPSPAEVAGNTFVLPTAAGAGQNPDGPETTEPSPSTIQTQTAIVRRDNCVYNLTEWQNNPQIWPVNELPVGAERYNTAELRGILHQPTNGDTTIILARQLIVAQLNDANGAPNDPAVEEALRWLENNPPGTLPTGTQRLLGENLVSDLVAYNTGRMGVPECRMPTAAIAQVAPTESPTAVPTATAATVCTQTDDEQIRLRRLADEHGTGYDNIIAWYCRGYGLGEIDRAYRYAAAVNTDPQMLFEMRAAGQGWSQIKQNLDVPDAGLPIESSSRLPGSS